MRALLFPALERPSLGLVQFAVVQAQQPFGGLFFDLLVGVRHAQSSVHTVAAVHERLDQVFAHGAFRQVELPGDLLLGHFFEVIQYEGLA